MREIKFRAWKESEKRMLYWGELCMSPSSLVDALNRVYLHAVMQYTGLKDKNDKEIYEGDVVKHVLWHDRIENRVVIYDNEMCAFLPMGEWCSTFPSLPNHFEIIGNIYENPELIKE